MVEQRKADYGVPLEPGGREGVTSQLQPLLRFLQRVLQADAQTDEPVTGGLALSEKDLVRIYLSHSGTPGQDSFGDGFLLIQGRKVPSNGMVVKKVLALAEIST